MDYRVASSYLGVLCPDCVSKKVGGEGEGEGEEGEVV